jgi:hypothetical protein
MELWQLIALLAAGALGVGALAKSSAAQATAAATGTPSNIGPTAAQTTLLNQVFQAALATETNVQILDSFATKLRTAGFSSYADAIDARASHEAMFLAPVLSKLTLSEPIQTTQSGAAYQSESVAPVEESSS